VKGKQVYIDGRLQTRRWDDKEGVKHTSVEVVANEMMMLGDRREHSNNATGASESVSDDATEMTANEDEFPF
jgi:single-strand DNA-binding protein